MAIVLHSVLERMPMQELQAILKWSESPQPTHSATRIEIINTLIKNVFDRDLKKTWALLLPIEQLAIAEAIYNNDGYISPEHIQAKHGQALVIKCEQSMKKKQVPKIRIFMFKMYGTEQPIPDDLINKLKTFVKKPKNYQIATQQTFSMLNPKIKEQRGQLTRFNAEASVLYDLRSILWLIKYDTLKIGVTGVPTVGLSKKISQMLVAPDYFADSDLKLKNIRGFSWMILSYAAGLVSYHKETVVLTGKGENILNHPPDPKTIKMIFDEFLNGTNIDFDETSRIDTMSNTKQGGAWSKTEFSNPKTRRRGVIETLKSSMEHTENMTNDGPWIRMTEFINYLRIQKPRFQVVNNFGNMRIGRQGIFAELLTDHWSVLEGTYIKCLFMEFLANLGMIEINYSVPVFSDNAPNSKDVFDFISTYDGLYEFRMTALGAYCMDVTKQPPTINARPEKIFHVTPNLEVTSVIDQMIPMDALFLNLCMDKVNAKTWRLNTLKLLSVVDDKNGFLTIFKAFIYERALSAIPKTVEHFFEDIERRVNHIIYVETAKIYVCQEHMLAQLIAHDAKTKHFCRLTGENQLVVPIKTEHEFKNGLKKVGYIIQQQVIS